MNNPLKSWFGQVTTGHGFMIVGSTLLAAISGSVTWTVAAPLLVAGAIGLVWPENQALQSAGQTVVTDIDKLVSAFRNKTGPGANPPF